jgi:hypothetical protein
MYETVRNPLVIRFGYDPRFFMSVDLGQAADYTAISVVERKEDTALVRHLERLPLGTPYPEQVQTVKRIFETITTKRDAVKLIVDHTGVGRAVVDLIKREGLMPVALTITAGNAPTKEGMSWHIPKRDLISSLIVAFQTGNVKIAKSLPEAETLTRELMNFKLKVNLQTGHDSYEAWREGIHDDLVLSVAMAVYAAEIGKPKAGFFGA